PAPYAYLILIPKDQTPSGSPTSVVNHSQAILPPRGGPEAFAPQPLWSKSRRSTARRDPHEKNILRNCNKPPGASVGGSGGDIS
ncbi:MAG: hypothetical protein KAU17_13545, partial [Spirochaetales bacterium]|nr:hypothetical protein [Spirochaetales bacterium]